MAGRLQVPSLHCPSLLHGEPTTPSLHVRVPSAFEATQYPLVQSAASRQRAPLAPEAHSPIAAPASVTHFPPEHSASLPQLR
jgi:hypothetical protein